MKMRDKGKSLTLDFEEGDEIHLTRYARIKFAALWEDIKIRAKLGE